MPTFNLTDNNDVFPQAGDNNSGDDTIFAKDGVDEIDGGSGNDIINGGLKSDTLKGGAGDDSIDCGLLPLEDIVDGGIGTDKLILNYEGVINLATNQPVDIILTFSAANFSVIVDSVVGVSASNCEMLDITLSDGDNRVDGGALADIIRGGTSNDVLRGLNGDDVISDRSGLYDADGGDGTDLLTVGETAGANTAASLTFDASGMVGSIASGTATSGTFRNFERYIVSGTSNGDQITLGAGDDKAFSGGGADTINGGGGNDEIDGGEGVDQINGQGGNDKLFAGSFNNGAQDADKLDGGDGDDIFEILTASTTGAVMSFAGASFLGSTGADTLDLMSSTVTVDFTEATISGIETLKYDSTFSGAVRLTAAQVNGLTNIDSAAQIRIMTAGDIVLDGTLTNGPDFYLFDGGQRLDMSTSSAGPGTFVSDIIGGAGADTVFGSARNDRFNGGGGMDVLNGGAGADGLSGGDDNDTLNGGEGNDAMNGGAGDDILNGGVGADTLNGGAGNDIAVSAGAGVVYLDLSGATDIFHDGSGSIDTLVGVESASGNGGDDAFIGDAASNIFRGEAGTDVLLGGGGDDFLFGGAGERDYLMGGATFGPAETGTGNDNAEGGDGVDVIYTQDGNDTIAGGAAGDFILAGAGDDTADGGTGDDFVFGGSDFVINQTGAGNDTLRGGDGLDFIVGGQGNDFLFGDAGNDILYGGSGIDALDGGAGDDNLVAGDGADTLSGGAGFDYLTGGVGADKFRFRKFDSYDSIFDFSAAEGDKLSLDLAFGVTTFAQFQTKLTGFTFEGVAYTVLDFPASIDRLTIKGIAHTAWTAGLVEFVA